MDRSSTAADSDRRPLTEEDAATTEQTSTRPDATVDAHVGGADDEAAGSGSNNLILVLLTNVCNMVLTFFEAIGLVVMGVLELLFGLVTQPVETVRNVNRGYNHAVRAARTFLRRNAPAVDDVIEECVVGVPKPLRYLTCILAVALVLVMTNHAALQLSLIHI